VKKSFVRGTWQDKRAYSPAVVTQGGRSYGLLVTQARRRMMGNHWRGTSMHKFARPFEILKRRSARQAVR
jgi:hypothetical protein